MSTGRCRRRRAVLALGDADARIGRLGRAVACRDRPASASSCAAPIRRRPADLVVGRILGEQGDKVVAELGTVTVNDKIVGTAAHATRQALGRSIPRPAKRSSSRARSKMRAASNTRAPAPASRSSEPLPFKVTVPDGQIFIASDNRHYHDDSRDFGAVAEGRVPRAHRSSSVERSRLVRRRAAHDVHALSTGQGARGETAEIGAFPISLAP